MSISIIQLGNERSGEEAVRIGLVRKLLKGDLVPAAAHKHESFDVWLPDLSPSEDLLGDTQTCEETQNWRTFERRFKAELKEPRKSHLLDLLAAMSHAVNFSIGCYCDDEHHCHRSILRAELKLRGADID